MKLISFIIFIFANTVTVPASAQFSFFSKACAPTDKTTKWTDCRGEASVNTAFEFKHFKARAARYSGEWKDGRPNGRGKIFSEVDADGTYFEIEGDFKSGVPAYGCEGPVRTNTKRHQINNEATNEKIQFEFPPERHQNGIKTVQVRGRTIEFSLNQISFFPQAEAPKIKTIRYDYFEPSGSRVIGNVLLLGIPLILNPIDRLIEMGGCSETPEIQYSPDKKHQTIIGGKWREIAERGINGSFNFSFEGLNKANEITIRFTSGNGVATFSDEQLIPLATDGLTSLKITCMTCNNQAESRISGDEKENVLLRTLNKEVSFDADLREATKEILAKAKANKEYAESFQRRVEEEIQQYLLEEERIAREGDGTPDDKACKLRRLKPSTQPYLKCRSDLETAWEKQEVLRLAVEEKKRIAEEAREKKLKLAEEARESKRIAAERQIEDSKRRQELAVNSSVAVAEGGRLSLDVSKIKCAELGFKPGTEGHGKCVLQLSK